MIAGSRPTVRRAALVDLAALAPLFDAYRRFYEQPADLARARAFLEARLVRTESAILVASAPGSDALAGFCQLYPTWCSIAAAPIFVLSDLFVTEGSRRAGIGRALMEAAQDVARDAGAARIDLSTARTNARAQALYESIGWRRDEVYLVYNFPLAGA